MKQNHRRHQETSAFVDPDFAEALDGATLGGTSSARQRERKTRQMCRQVQRALNLALADRGAQEDVNELYVEEVSPAPDCGHLLVHVVVLPQRLVNEALGALRRDAARLRSEVAIAINRKRAPELSFVPVCPVGGEDE